MGANGGANGLCPGYGLQDLMALENGWVLKSIYASSFSAMYMIWCQHQLQISYPHFHVLSCWSVMSISSAQSGQVWSPSLLMVVVIDKKSEEIAVRIPMRKKKTPQTKTDKTPTAINR